MLIVELLAMVIINEIFFYFDCRAVSDGYHQGVIFRWHRNKWNDVIMGDDGSGQISRNAEKMP